MKIDNLTYGEALQLVILANVKVTCETWSAGNYLHLKDGEVCFVDGPPFKLSEADRYAVWRVWQKPKRKVEVGQWYYKVGSNEKVQIVAELIDGGGYVGRGWQKEALYSYPYNAEGMHRRHSAQDLDLTRDCEVA
jgi:hypothetical protein